MSFLVYGANGYTGELIVREAVARGHRPIVAGRDGEAIGRVASKYGLEARAFSLDDRDAARAAVGAAGVVIHCAGPFVHTSRAMVDACVQAKAHYLDITGEIAVFESIMRRDSEARAAGVSLIPGVGFDVVPSDCLAAELHEAMPDAEELILAFWSRGGGISRGTLRTMIEGIPAGGAIRRGGKIVRVPVAWDVREIPFEGGMRNAVTIPWGDVSTAYHTTSIPNIRTYIAASPRAIRSMKRMASAAPLLRIRAIRRFAQWLVSRHEGPSEAQRANASVELWGQVSKGEATLARTLRTPEGYRFTALAAVAAAERVASGLVPPGASTPARAFGSGFARQLIRERA